MADLVLRLFRNRTVLPKIAKAVQDLPLFAGLNAEQVTRLAGVCGVGTFNAGDIVFQEGEASKEMHVVLQGEVGITLAGRSDPVGLVRSGECLGEMSLLTSGAHSATATARTQVETMVLGHQDLAALIRLRPDIALHIYANLAVGLGKKLNRSDRSLGERNG